MAPLGGIDPWADPAMSLGTVALFMPFLWNRMICCIPRGFTLGCQILRQIWIIITNTFSALFLLQENRNWKNFWFWVAFTVPRFGFILSVFRLDPKTAIAQSRAFPASRERVIPVRNDPKRQIAENRLQFRGLRSRLTFRLSTCN